MFDSKASGQGGGKEVHSAQAEPPTGSSRCMEPRAERRRPSGANIRNDSRIDPCPPECDARRQLLADHGPPDGRRADDLREDAVGHRSYGKPHERDRCGSGSWRDRLPPSHIKRPDILGHETLHLFALVDRYLTLPRLGEFGLRETKGRQDPLGADEEGKVRGKILEEDLGFVLEHVGVYPNIPFNDVLAELNEVDEIIRTGRDPNSLIRKRHDFVPEMIKQVEDLP